MYNKLTAIAPHRISICGGGTDFPSFYKQHNGAVLNFAITRYSKIKLRKLKNKFIVDASDVNEYYNGTKEELIKVCGHYVFSSDECIALKAEAASKILGLDEYLKNKVKESIFRYMNAFNLT